MAKKYKCKVCKGPFEKIYNTTQRTCSPLCAIEDGRKVRTIGTKEFDEETRRKKAKLRDSDLGKQKELTQDVFNKMRRLEELKWFSDRGIRPYCISCGKENMDWCCGHYKTVGAQGILRFDRANTYLQCNRYCNKGLSGNIAGNKTTRGYTEGLKLRFGEEEAAKILEYLTKTNQPERFSCDQLKLMRKGFNKKIRELLDCS